MKLLNHFRARQKASTLLLALLLAGVAGITLASFLTMVGDEVRFTARSQAWSTCMPVTESGIEEALTHCYYNYVTNMETSGWSLVGTNYVKTNTMLSFGKQNGNGGGKAWGKNKNANGAYNVCISATLPYVITSFGYTPGISGNSADIVRTVRVRTKNLGVFSAAMIVRDSVDMNGNNIKADSYDPTDSTKSTGGAYDAAKASDKGDVVSLNGLGDSLNIGNANIWGHAYTGPSGYVTYGANGSVGDVAWQKGGNKGVKSGWWQKDFNATLPDVVEPFKTAAAPGSGSVGGTNYPYVLSGGNYQLSALNRSMMVTGKAVLYVTGDIKFAGSDAITIAPGATLTIYQGGTSALFGDVNNGNVGADTFSYYGLPSVTSVQIKGQNKLVGSYYAPTANFVMNGGGDVFGSVVMNSVRMTGNSAFHYDESLLNKGMTRGFIVVDWTEL